MVQTSSLAVESGDDVLVVVPRLLLWGTSARACRLQEPEHVASAAEIPGL